MCFGIGILMFVIGNCHLDFENLTFSSKPKILGGYHVTIYDGW